MQMILLLLVFSATAMASSNKGVHITYWGSTFAYNTLSVKAQKDSSFFEIQLEGSDLGLIEHLEENPVFWRPSEIQFIIPKDLCLLDEESSQFNCDGVSATRATIKWGHNPSIHKVLFGQIKNVRLSAGAAGVSLTFNLPSTEDFSPIKNDISIHFGSGFSGTIVTDRLKELLEMDLREAVTRSCQVGTAYYVSIVSFTESGNGDIDFKWNYLNDENVKTATAKSIPLSNGARFIEIGDCGN